MSFNLSELFHSLVVKKIVEKVLVAAKPEIDALLLSVPGAAPFKPEADALLDIVVGRLTHLEQNQEAKEAKADETVVS
jgi:hypothetical protein